MPNVEFQMKAALEARFKGAEVSVEQTGRSFDTLSPYTIRVKRDGKSVEVHSVKTLAEVIEEVASKL